MKYEFYLQKRAIIIVDSFGIEFFWNGKKKLIPSRSYIIELLMFCYKSQALMFCST